MPRVVDEQELDDLEVRRFPEKSGWLQHPGLHGSPGDATHCPETRGSAALLTMRILDLILRSALLRASRRIEPRCLRNPAASAPHPSTVRSACRQRETL